MAQVGTAPGGRTPRLLRPFEQFFALESSSGILLLLAAAVALVWANTPFSGSYFHLWEMPVTVGFGAAVLTKTLHHWINDGLMAVFFFVVGLELKREILVGELAAPKKAALSVAAALGGMIVPALIYAYFNRGTPGAAGWGVPMATDIAFALGVIALLGSRVPVTLKIFVTAVAIVDDLGAVLVIALFYTADISWNALAIGGIVYVVLILLNFSGAQRPLYYAIPGLVLWGALLQSGVHATIAGVLLAFTIPAKRRIDAPEYLERVNRHLAEMQKDMRPGERLATSEQLHAVHAIEKASEETLSPLRRLEHALHPLVVFFIVPLFALANAGVSLRGDIGATFTSTITAGVLLGLVLGKPFGILVASWLAVRSGLASLPDAVGWRHLAGAGMLCGIGFTMSLFIATLAFDATPPLLDEAKIGVLSASLIAGVVGAVMLMRRTRAV